VQILPGLYVGDCRDARDVKQLEENKITDILAVFDLARPILAVTVNVRR
jgi:atypical dual specificity phosphatase